MSEAPAIPRIAICIPTRDVVMAVTTQALMKMVGHFCTHFVGKGQAELVTLTDLGTLLPDMRNALAKEAIKQGATHVLWIDSDMTFPHDTIERLLAHKVPMVGANYAQRKRPVKPTAAKFGNWLYTEEASTGLEAVEYCGMGVFLVETEVFRHLPEPWHCLGWNEAEKRMIGEDVWFFRLAQQLGIVPIIDHDLSKEVEHVGYHPFTLTEAVADIPAARAAQEAAKNNGA